MFFEFKKISSSCSDFISSLSLFIFINKNYFIACRECIQCIPHINIVEYDSKVNDFKLTYVCPCDTKNKIKTAYLKELIVDYDAKQWLTAPKDTYHSLTFKYRLNDEEEILPITQDKINEINAEVE